MKYSKLKKIKKNKVADLKNIKIGYFKFYKNFKLT